MALKVADRVRENTSSTGVGGLSLTGAPAGFQTFDSVLSSGDTTFYALEENDKFEIGIGTYGSNNLERTTVLTSSSAGSKISLGGSGSVFITYPAEKAAFITDVTSVSGIAAYASGLAQSGGGDVTTAQLQYVSGIAVYSSGKTPSIDVNTSNIATNTSNIASSSSNIVATSGIANYASGIAGQNESDVVAVSGIANYASGGSNFTAGSGLSLVGAEFNMSGTGRLQELQIKSSSSTPKIVFTGSGALSDINVKANTDDKSFSPSGTSISFEGSEGQLLNITDNLSSGNIFNVSNISGLPLFEIDASGDVKIARRGRYVGVGSGIPEFGLDVSASGRIQKGVALSSYVPAVTTNTLYNDGGTLSWNGSAIAGASSIGSFVKLNVESNNANNVTATIKGTAGQAADLQQWQDNTELVRAKVDNVGNFLTSGNITSASGQIFLPGGGGTTSPTLCFTGSSNKRVGFYEKISDQQISFTAGGRNRIIMGDDRLQVNNAAYIGWSSSAVGEAQDGTDLALRRESSGVMSIRRNAATSGPSLGEIIASGVSASGVELPNHVPASTTNRLYNEGGTLKFNGSAVGGGGGGGGTSAEATYASGQVNVSVDGTAEASKALILDSAKSFTGVKDGRFSQFDSFVYSTGVNVGNSGILLARNTPGVTTDTLYNIGGALYFNGSQLASAGASSEAAYASGQAISNQSNITALNTASGIATSLLAVSGTATSLVASSGIATYASGQAIENESNIAVVSGVAYNIFNIVSGNGNDYIIDGMGLGNAADPDIYLHKGHSYTFNKTFSGHPFRVSATEGGSVYQDADGNNIEIGSSPAEVRFEVPQDAPDKLHYYCTSHPSNMKGIIYTTNNVDEIIHVSGIAAYASGQAISNQGNITALLTASGTATSLIASSGISTYASGQAIANESDIVATSGIANYASGQAISNQSNITALNTASGIATSLLAVSGTATSLVATSGIATYASGQAIANESDIAALLTASGTATSLIASSGIATYASGQAIANEGDLVAVSGIAAYASGVSLTVKEADNSPNVSNVRTIVVSNGTLTDNGAGQVTLSTGGGGGGMTNFTLAGDGGSNQTIADGNTLTVAGGNGITTAGAATDTVSIAVDAAQTTITSLLATDIKIGEDNETKIDFETADEIHFYANNVEQVYLADNIFGPQSDSDVDLGSTGVRWKDAFVDSITVTGEIDGDSLDIEGDADINGTTNLDAVDIDGNVQIDGTVTVGVDDTGKDVKFFGATSGSYFEWDESEDRLNLVGAAYVNEAVPANDTPTAEDATVTLDLKKGNYHNISLGQNVTKFEFLNAKRGQRFLLRITQNASSAKTISWSNVDYTSGGAAATVRWAGNITPTMSTSTSHTDVYGFLCTNNAGSAFDGFIVGQDLHD
tara:strand:+ start:14162 stop:18337 length:4176 start_codon:yes stop_codon:yes gene_type:complete